MNDETQEKTTAPAENEQPAAAEKKPEPELPPKPICPYCGADPVMPIGRGFNMGPAKIMIVICRDCHKVIPVLLLDIAQPRIQMPGPGPRILRPE